MNESSLQETVYTIDLKHIGGTIKTVEVLGVDPYVPKLMVKWESPGEPYMFDLKKNKLILGLRKESQWSAVDMKVVIDLWVHLKNNMRYLNRNTVVTRDKNGLRVGYK